MVDANTNRLTAETHVYPEVASIDTPPAGHVAVANKAGVMTSKTHDGTETELGGGGTDITADTFTLADGSELTIASGAITVTHTRHTVDTEADADTDDLITVNGLAANEICLITANHTDRTIVVKNSGGNITCATGTDIWLDDTVKAVLLMGNTAGTGVWAYAIGTAFPVPDTQILMFNPDAPQGKLKFSIALLENATRTVSWIDENITPLGTNNTQTFLNKNSANQFQVGGLNDEIQFQVTGNASQTADIVVFQRSNGDDLFVVRQSENVFNEAGLDIDTRIETNNDANALFVDGGNDNVGFGTGTPDASAKVDVSSTTKGFLPPRMTTAQFAAISSKPDGLMAYDTDLDKFVGMQDGAVSVIGATVVTANKVHKFGGVVSTSSTSMTDVDATNAAITATLTGSGKCLVTFHFGANKATGGSGFFRITDGTNHSTEVEFTSTMALSERSVSWIFTSTAGSTTYKLQFRSSDANNINFRGDISAMHATLMEIA